VIILYGGQIRAEGALDDLLTVSDKTRILTPQLPKNTMDKVLELLRENLDGEEFKIDHPRRTLEEFFLDVITQARSESVETAGVAGGSGIAEYLTGNDPEDKNAVLDSLLQEGSAAVKAPAAPAPAPEETVSAGDEKLAEVLGETQSAKAVEEVKNVVAENAENMRRANDKLDSLLGGKSSGE
jgi:ABC-2 type transport system ATP-binding protein